MSINPAYFNNLGDDLNSTVDNIHGDEQVVCAAIQQFEQEAMAEINAAIAAVRTEINNLLPMITIPTNLGGCIAWITNAAQPYIKALAAAEADLAQTLAAAAALEEKIAAAAASLTKITCTINPTLAP